MDPLNSMEAGRRAMRLSLIGARAFGWLVSIELGKRRASRLLVRAGVGVGYDPNGSASAAVGTHLPPRRTLCR
jgi:hypothetical protein